MNVRELQEEPFNVLLSCAFVLLRFRYQTLRLSFFDVLMVLALSDGACIARICFSTVHLPVLDSDRFRVYSSGHDVHARLKNHDMHGVGRVHGWRIIVFELPLYLVLYPLMKSREAIDSFVVLRVTVCG